ncbi:MAG: polysaccharide deacetylase family protein [Elusimicrobiaceae bacterium]|nr:polysaccharide deacetylase family protein [Elusimicrobiaceae bacterium]MBP5616765.1 polysaccharide deacetylase family protein [Elusimicrobiaceae bacterium]
MIYALLIILGIVYFLIKYPKLRKTWYWPKHEGLVALMYHHIGVTDPNDEQFPFTVTPEMFEKQLQFLNEHNYTSISEHTLYRSFMTKEKNDICHPVLLTFDDGYEDFYTYVYPLLEKYHAYAIVFLITDRIGTTGYLSWEQIHLMEKGGHVAFGSHSCSHRRLRSLNDEEILHEIKHSKEVLEKVLHHKVRSFCYPFGAGGFDKRVRPQVLSAGYLFDFSTKNGINPWPWLGKKTILRAFPRGGEDLYDFHLQLTRGRSKL